MFRIVRISKDGNYKNLDFEAPTSTASKKQFIICVYTSYYLLDSQVVYMCDSQAVGLGRNHSPPPGCIESEHMEVLTIKCCLVCACTLLYTLISQPLIVSERIIICLIFALLYRGDCSQDKLGTR